MERAAVEWFTIRVGWTLVPAVVGFFVRFLVRGTISVDCISPTELSLSMALLSFMMVLESVRRPTSRQEEDLLAKPAIVWFFLLLVVFLGTYCVAVAREDAVANQSAQLVRMMETPSDSLPAACAQRETEKILSDRASALRQEMAARIMVLGFGTANLVGTCLMQRKRRLVL